MEENQDVDSLIEEFEELTDLIYEDEKMIINIENTIVKLKENYNLLFNKEKIKRDLTKKLLINFFKKMIFSGFITIPLSVFVTPMLLIPYTILLAVFFGYETKKWFKATEAIRTLEKTTNIDNISNGICRQEDNLYELNSEIKYNQNKIKSIQEKIRVLHNQINMDDEVREADIIELDKILMKRVRKIG